MSAKILIKIKNVSNKYINLRMFGNDLYDEDLRVEKKDLRIPKLRIAIITQSTPRTSAPIFCLAPAAS